MLYENRPLPAQMSRGELNVGPGGAAGEEAHVGFPNLAFFVSCMSFRRVAHLARQDAPIDVTRVERHLGVAVLRAGAT